MSDENASLDAEQDSGGHEQAKKYGTRKLTAYQEPSIAADLLCLGLYG